MSGDLKRGRGRPPASKKFKLVLVPRAALDHRKLGRAFLALAVHRAEKDVRSDVQATEPRDG